MNTKEKLYADDLVLYSTERDPRIAHANVQQDLDRLTGWWKLTKLTVNAKKSKAMVYGTKGMLDRYNPPKLKIDDKEMGYVDSFTYLGIKLDKELKFDQQLKRNSKNGSS